MSEKKYFKESFCFEGHYKGNKLFKLARNDHDDRPFMFGLSKAKLMLDCIDEIKEWVEKNDFE